HARSERHAARDREPLPQRAGGDLDPRRVVLAGMPLKVAVHLAEAEQILKGEVAPLTHQRVDDRRDVSDREMPQVAGGIVEAAGIHVHLVEEEHGAEVRGGERTAAVPRLGAGEERHDVPAHEERALLELTDGHSESRHVWNATGW